MTYRLHLVLHKMGSTGWHLSVRNLPGSIAYGHLDDAAVKEAVAVVLQVLGTTGDTTKGRLKKALDEVLCRWSDFVSPEEALGPRGTQ